MKQKKHCRSQNFEENGGKSDDEGNANFSISWKKLKIHSWQVEDGFENFLRRCGIRSDQFM